jgi:hypothetical protein
MISSLAFQILVNSHKELYSMLSNSIRVTWVDKVLKYNQLGHKFGQNVGTLHRKKFIEVDLSFSLNIS